MQVANTILQQIGGNRFIAMTGAKNLVASENALHFSIGRGAINKANKVRISLVNSDLYTVEFFNVRGVNIKEISTVHGIYADKLAKVFTQETGMDTHL